MVEDIIIHSEQAILKRLVALEVYNEFRDPEDEDEHVITIPEQLSLLSERIDKKTEPIIQEYVPQIEPRTTLEHKATEFALHVKDFVTTTGKMFLDSKEIMRFMKHELPEPLRMKDIQNPRQFKRNVLQKAKRMFPFIALDKKTVPLQKIWIFYKTSEKHHKSDIYMP